jgi:hypothetical protein
MARRAFYSFHFTPDSSRAGQVRNMGVVEGDAPVSDNDWEKVTRGGDEAIKRWIDDQMCYKSVTIVLIGANTAGRKWIKHEIIETWNKGKAVLGVYIHGLKDFSGNTTTKGANPFDDITLGDQKLSSIVNAYDAWGFDSKEIYAAIKRGLPDWIEAAIAKRQTFAGATV